MVRRHLVRRHLVVNATSLLSRYVFLRSMALQRQRQDLHDDPQLGWSPKILRFRHACRLRLDFVCLQ